MNISPFLLRMCLASGLLFTAQACLAEYLAGQTTSKLYGGKYFQFGVHNPPTGKVCNYFGRHFRFDATTSAGKNILSVLMAAEMADRKVDIWFSKSTAPDTDEESGCDANSLAVIYQIGLADI